MLQRSWTFVLVTFSFLYVNTGGYDDKTFRAAVYEHATVPPNREVVVTRQEALEYMTKNLEVYRKVTEEARLQSVDIIVFPEDGLTYLGHSRKSIQPYLEYIPDPNRELWNPCENPKKYPNTEVQHTLSCLAKNNSLYIVANMGDIQPCDAANDTCPPDHHYQFNTDVVYDSFGTLIAKYHKINLYFEFNFDPSTSKEAVTFETPFGTFGVFTCFDILFWNPVVVLMKERGVSNIAFPTAWIDTPPFLAAVQFHSAVAAGFGVNFLSANMHIPQDRFLGSGIYSPEGARTYYYNNSVSSGGKLLVSDLNILPRKSPWNTISLNNGETYNDQLNNSSGNQEVFQAETFGDMFNYVALSKSSGKARVCHNKLCCTASYTSRENITELYALGAFDGLHTKQGTFYIQVCGIVRCKTNNKSSCGEGSVVSNTYFTQLKLFGTFRSPYIFPEILLFGDDTYQLAPPNNWSYANGTLEAKRLEQPLLAFSLFSRDYDYDPTNSSAGRRVTIITFSLILLTFLLKYMYK
ncbi:pantetheinase-like [Saccostrea echinata]|uniref:pantetheinase-like n=1 Tax=Saccostrea echinata TaxID=191078 RepID=UPI002A802720|nr:pantetheinase-like [Saccostrea echinata]